MSYFLQKQCTGYYVVYAQGIPVLNINDLYNFKIIKMYPSPSKDLTYIITNLQKKWRNRQKLIHWYSNPFQIRYRELHGRFPPYK